MESDLSTIIFGNDTSKDEFELYEYPLPESIFFTVLSLLAMLADGLILQGILKGKARRDIKDILIINWAIIDFIQLVFESSKFAVLFMITGDFLNSSHKFHVFIQIHIIVQCFEIVLIIISCVDCLYNKLTLENVTKKLRTFWISFVVFFVCTFVFSRTYSWKAGFICCLILTYLLSLIVVFKLINFARKRGKCVDLRKKPMFLLACGYAVCWFPISVVDFCESYLSIDLEIPSIGFDALLGLGYSSPIILFWILFLVDDEFKGGVTKIWGGNRGGGGMEEGPTRTVSTELVQNTRL